MSLSNNPLELLIALGVNDEVTRKNINSYIAQLKNLETVKISLDTNDVKNAQQNFGQLQNEIQGLQNQLKNLQKEMKGVSNDSPSFNTQKFKQAVQQSVSTLDELKRKALELGGTLKIDEKNVDGQRIVTQVTASFKNAQNEVEKVRFKPEIDVAGVIVGFKEVTSSMSNVMNNDTLKAYEKANLALRDLGIQGNLTSRQLKNFEDQLKGAKSIDEIQKVTNDFKSLNKESSALESKANILQKFTKEVEKLYSKGYISKQEKLDFINTASVKESTKEIQTLQSQLQRLGQNVESFDRIKNATNSAKDAVNQLNERLNLVVSKQGSNVDTGKLDSVKSKIQQISSIEIKSVADISRLNELIDSTNRRITALGNNSNHMERFNNTIYKAKEALGQLERSGYASEITINKLKNQLNSVETGNLNQVKNALRAISEEKKKIGEQNSLSRGVTEVNNSVARLQSDLTKTVNLYRKSVDTVQVQRLQEEIRKLSNLDLTNPAKVDQAKRDISRLREEIKQLTADATVATRNSMGIIESFKTAMVKFPVWMGASTLFYSSIRSAREFMTIIVDIDTKLTNISKVMSEDMDIAKVLNDATISANTFG